MFDAITRFNEIAKAEKDHLRQRICDDLNRRNLAFEEVSVAFVRGEEIIGTAYVCRSEKCGEDGPLTSEDIELGAYIDKNTLILSV